VADANSIVIASEPPERLVDQTETSVTRFASTLASEIGSSSRSVEDIFVAKHAAAAAESRRAITKGPAGAPIASNADG